MNNLEEIHKQLKALFGEKFYFFQSNLENFFGHKDGKRTEVDGIKVKLDYRKQKTQHKILYS